MLAEVVSLCYIRTMKTLNEVIEKGGGTSKLAREISKLLPGTRKITSQAISQWKEIPVRKVKYVSKITGFTAEELCPEVFEVL